MNQSIGLIPKVEINFGINPMLNFLSGSSVGTDPEGRVGENRGRRFDRLRYPSASRGTPMRERCGANRQASPRIAPDTVAIMPAALTASAAPNHNGP
jgi:hypothetical protein